MESFDTTLVDVKPVLNYKNGLRKRETTQKMILYGVISFILLSLVILTFKYISTTSKMTSTINEISSAPVGYQYIIFLTIAVDGEMTTFESHKLADNLETNISGLDKVYKAVVHVEPFLE